MPKTPFWRAWGRGCRGAYAAPLHPPQDIFRARKRAGMYLFLTLKISLGVSAQREGAESPLGCGYRDEIRELVPDSVARLWRAPPYAAKRKDLVSATVTAYAAKAIAGARLSFATVRFAPITVVAHRAKAGPFRRSSILFRPHTPQMKGKFGGVAGYRPRVRAVYYGCVYRHSLGYPKQSQHRRAGGPAQGIGKRKRAQNLIWARLDLFCD